MVGHKRMVKQEPARLQTCVFRVNIHCDGCKKKVKKLVQKIKGVESIAIDAELGKLTVVGYVSPSIVIKNLGKSGKHAEMWGAQKNSYNPDHMNNKFKNMQIDFYDSGAEKQLKKGGGRNQIQPMRKDRQPVKFEFSDEDEQEFYKGEGSPNDFDDLNDGFELDFDRESRKKPVHASKGVVQGKKKKKGGIFGIFKLGKKEKKTGNGGKKGGGARKSYSREERYGGKAIGKSPGHIKNGSSKVSGPNNGRSDKYPTKDGGSKNDLAHQGKKSGPSFEIDLFDRGKGGGSGRGGSGRGGEFGGAAGGKLAGQTGQQPGTYPKGQAQYEAHGGDAPMYQTQAGSFPTSNYPMGLAQHQNMARVGPMNQAPMNFPAANQVRGVPAMGTVNAGYYPAMGQGSMYNPQYMAMMGQQPAQFSGMARPMMYGGPNHHPSINYMPPVASSRFTDPYTLMFNDENTESCSIM